MPKERGVGGKAGRVGVIGAVEETNVLLEVSSESGDQWPEIRWYHSCKNNFLSIYCVTAARDRDEKGEGVQCSLLGI